MNRVISGWLALCLALGSCSTGSGSRAANERLDKAKALFAERCKSSGEKIYKTVEDVEGVLLMKVRPEKPNLDNQYLLDDPYGHDLGGRGYIASFLRGHYQANNKGISPNAPSRVGYQYVETEDPQSGQRYRYTGRLEEPWLTDKNYLKGYIRYAIDIVKSDGSPPRYGTTYEDISTREDRDYWIAGSSLRVVDLRTGELVAERIGYMVDWAQGSRAGGRSPWLYAANNACPSFYRNTDAKPAGNASTMQFGQALEFVEKSLKPKI